MSAMRSNDISSYNYVLFTLMSCMFVAIIILMIVDKMDPKLRACVWEAHETKCWEFSIGY